MLDLMTHKPFFVCVLKEGSLATDVRPVGANKLVIAT